MARFTNTEHDKHFTYVIYDGNARAPLKNASVSIQIRGRPTDIFAREMYAFMLPAHDGCSRYIIAE
jgi:hypothetical protein